MDLNKFEYQKVECVKAFKILAFIYNSRKTDHILLLDSGMPNMPFAVYAPYGVNASVISSYLVMYDDGNYDILTETEFNLEYMPRIKP